MGCIKGAKRGLTRLEVCILLPIAVLVGFKAFSYAEQALEEIRRSDVIKLMDTEIAAQERRRLGSNGYTKAWDKLDTTPVHMRNPSDNNRFSDGVANTVFYTKGKREDGTPVSGFRVYFENRGTRWFVTAERVGSSKYDYTLVRPFDSMQVFCTPNNQEEQNIKACLKTMNLKSVDQLLPDPR